MDFSKYPVSNRYYGGSERKVGIRAGDSEYMLKFRKRDEFGVRNNHISEYIGSHVFGLLGFDVHETMLGTYNGEQVVACRSFIGPGEQFVPFNDVGESSLEQDKESYQYSYSDIMRMLEENRKLTEVEQTVSTFWEIFIVDALLANFDRHGANWGFLKANGVYRLAPVFDNGSCLFPRLVDETDMLDVIGSKEETDRRIYQFPTSQIKLHGKKSSYAEVIGSLEFPECNRALESVFERVDLDAIEALIGETEFTTEVQQAFLSHMVRARYEAILAEPYGRLKGLGS